MARRRVRGGPVAAGLASLALALAALVVTAGADAGPSAERMLDRLDAAPLPARDPVDLAIRLRGVPVDVARQAPPSPPVPQLGQHDTFSVLDQRAAQTFQVTATLRAVTEHAYWYVQDDRGDRASQADLQRSADALETRTYPVVARYFGADSLPLPGGDPHVVFLLAGVPGVAAYFSGVDTYRRAVSPRSNEREMIFVNVDALPPGQPAFDSTMAHELQHLLHFAHCPAQETWVDEGASELASRVAGYDGPAPRAFTSHPDVQLTAWAAQPGELTRHYQAAYLFIRYVAERYGGWDVLPELLHPCLRGGDLFARFLGTRGGTATMDDLFADWAVANLVDDPTLADGRYGYTGEAVRVSPTGRAAWGTPFASTVPQFAADYVELPAGAGQLRFTGDATVPLLGAAPTPGPAVWWSNRGDGLDTRLTRSLDLRAATRATARFRVWYDVEDQFDYVYLSASRDGGATWTALPGQLSSTDAAVGNAIGPGWTGTSGGGAAPAWVDEAVDLTPIVGAQVLLRFEYVTDQAYNGAGFAFADFTVPELGLAEPGAADGPWAAEGWLRVDSPVPQRWSLRLVRWLPGGVEVDPVPVDDQGAASVDVDGSASRVVLVVAPTAPRTLEAARYSVTPVAGESAPR